MDLNNLMRYARAYSNLGSSVGGQLDSIVESGGDIEGLCEAGELNMNAAAMAHEWLSDVSDDAHLDGDEELSEMTAELAQAILEAVEAPYDAPGVEGDPKYTIRYGRIVER
jgi:hypothetical protein